MKDAARYIAGFVAALTIIAALHVMLKDLKMDLKEDIADNKRKIEAVSERLRLQEIKK